MLGKLLFCMDNQKLFSFSKPNDAACRQMFQYLSFYGVQTNKKQQK